jgi:hypothetical protein
MDLKDFVQDSLNDRQYVALISLDVKALSTQPGGPAFQIF